MADQADLARELLPLEDDDLTAARALADVPAKALKAGLAVAGRDFPFTHNIAALMQLREDAGIRLPASLDTLDLLTPYGVAARYGARFPGTIDRASARDLAVQAVAWARAVIEASPGAGSSGADPSPIAT